jgi:hypothetical protein
VRPLLMPYYQVFVGEMYMMNQVQSLGCS